MPTIRGLLSDLNNTMNVAYPPLAALNAARKVIPNITMSGLIGGTVDSAKKAYTAPIRAMRGEFNADSPQAYEEALNLAGLIGSSTLPRLTQPVQHGVSSMFIGPKAKTWNAAKAAEAEKMLAEGVDPKEVWSKTGTMRGVDGNLRQEIADNTAKWIKNLPFQKRVEPMNAVISHDGLYRAYPETENITAAFGQNVNAQGGVGSYHFDPALRRGIINIESGGSDAIKNAKSTGLHELQHAIQEREGWARGGSPDTSAGVGITKDDTLDFARKAYEYSHQSSGDPLLDELFSGAKKWEELTPREQLGWIDQGRMYAYSRLAGEAEARLTQTRMNMTPEQRLATYPYDQLDVPLNQLIVRGLLK